MRPTKLSHVVFHENSQLGFITYDDEHHRVAFVDFGPQLTCYGDAERAKEPPVAPGLHHVAFTFGCIAFAANPIGVDFDPEDYSVRSGADASALSRKRPMRSHASAASAAR